MRQGNEQKRTGWKIHFSAGHFINEFKTIITHPT